MCNVRFLTHQPVFAAIALIVGAFFIGCPTASLAATASAAPPTQNSTLQGRILPNNPLAVTDIVIDKTAANPVVAREQAIEMAKQAAFRKLAFETLGAEGFAHFSMPSDNDISLAVQDFEIENEQMSSTRYIGTFTVRFSALVKNYFAPNAVAPPSGMVSTGLNTTPFAPPVKPLLNIDQTAPQPDAQGIIWNTPPRAASAPENRNNPAAPVSRVSSILVLPYYEDISGQTLLWEEPNPWLHIWQNNVPPPAADGLQFIVPLGDIGDIAQGSDKAVWAGNYKTVEALRRHYHADAVALAVANRSGPTLSIDMYYYVNNSLRRRITLTPFVPAEATDEEAFKQGLNEVLRSLQPKPGLVRATLAPASVQAPAPRPQVFKPRPQPVPAPIPEQPALPPGIVQVTAQMGFATFGGWMDVQRRVAAINPPVKLALRALTSDSAQFTLTYAGSTEALVDVLAKAGLVLGSPAKTPSGAVLYDLSLSH